MPGGPIKQNIVSAGGGDFQGALHILLALDFGKIQVVVGRLLENLCDVHFDRGDFDFAFQKLRRLAQVLNGNYLQAGDDRGFGGVFRRNQHANFAFTSRAKRHRQNSFAGPNRARQRQFANGDEILELVGLDLLAGCQHAERDGQIKTRPFLFHVGGREIDGRAAHREFVAGIGERGRHPVARFLHRRVRQPDDDDEGLAPAGVDLDFDRERFNAVERGGANFREHEKFLRQPLAKATGIFRANSHLRFGIYDLRFAAC